MKDLGRMLLYPVWKLICAMLFIHHAIKIILEEYDEASFHEDLIRCKANLPLISVMAYSYLLMHINLVLAQQ